jgi:hypothetical protein
MFVLHFRGKVDLPKKSTTWNLAQINETEPRPVLFELDPRVARKPGIKIGPAFSFLNYFDVRGFEARYGK